ncbi:MAG: PilZ domain-containing protein [Pseudomonadota bacterium]|nr:PilZ domain-containing protein [Pseudomonadota bacterium]MDP1906604.1 PilZ domain-containing protein [Pseudomonadota bacterium]MDP2353814.1 PilZ domain-containing protein [Pseudomonadota bacterium]
MDGSETDTAKQDQVVHDADFTDMHLKVGELLIAQPLAVSGAEPFTVSFIGAHGRLSFLTSLPSAGDRGMWVTPGSQFKFRVVHGMYAYAFTARSLRTHSRPYPYVHFSMPEGVKYRQIRQSHRLETRLPVEISRADGSRTLAIMRDISEHGAKLEMSCLLDEVGAEITLTIPILLPQAVSSLTVTGTIRNRGDLEHAMAAGRFYYGVSFTSLAPEAATLLQHFIDHLLAEQLA